MEVPGGAAEGPPRFQCPEEFCARRLAPGPAFCPESLQGSGKQLLLIRAPANFCPESFTGQTLPMIGSHVTKASQPDAMQKVYCLQTNWEDLGSYARLLIPSGQPDHLTCAPPFSGSLSIRERYGDPGTAQPLFPVADRPTPPAPEGLTQRFFPFGGWPKRPSSSEARENPPRKKGKKWRLPVKHEPGEGGGPQQLPPGFTGAARGLPGEPTRVRHKQCLLKGEAEVVAELAKLPAPDAQPNCHLEEGLLSGEEGDPGRRKSGRRKKKQENRMEMEEMLCQQPGQEPEGGGVAHAGEPALGGNKLKRWREAAAEGLQDGAAAVREHPGGIARLGSFPGETLGSVTEEPGRKLPGHKKKEKGGKEPPLGQWAEAQHLEPSSAVLDWHASGAPLGQEVELEEPLQPDGAGLTKDPRRRRKRRRSRGEQTRGSTAAGT